MDQLPNGDQIVIGHFYRGRRWAIAIGLSCLVLASSCGKTTKIPEVKGNLLPVYPVKGTLEMNGKPFAGAALKFYPLTPFPSDASRILPHAWTQEDGSFTVSTYADNDGAPVGRYRVTVRFRGAGPPRDDDRDLMPPEYSNARMTRLTTKVEEGENTLPSFKIELAPEQAAKLMPEVPEESEAGS
jgi:hypothetical protein